MYVNLDHYLQLKDSNYIEQQNLVETTSTVLLDLIAYLEV